MRYKPIFIYILLLLSLVGIVLGENPAALAASDTAGKAEELSYTDVTKQEANYIFIKYISQQGIIKGFPDGSFHPADGLTRAQAAVIIGKAAGLAAPPPGNSSFKDVVSNHWALNYIEAAAKAGYLKGFPDGSYQPEASLTRAQGISLIMRLCTQKERAPLPQLKDLTSQHWAASAMGTAISLEMIGVSSDGKNVYPEANMTRSGMARALAILLTEDPGLSKTALEGKLNEISGQVTLTRNGQSQLIISDCLVIQGDKIETGSNGSVRISYPDGSSNLMEASSTIVVKESQGRRYIKKDGTAGVAVDYLNLSMEQGTLYGALATKHREGEPSEKSTDEKIENSTLSRTAMRQLAAVTGFRYLAAAANESPAAPWYKTAETKKVKVKVDMPWGVAAIRGTFVKITVNPDKTCRVSCLTGSADLTGQTGTGITLSGNDTANVRQEQTSANKESALNSEDKATFSETKVQVFFMDASVEQEVNQSADVTPEVASEQVTRGPESTVKAVIEALKESGIALTREAVKELQTKVAEVLGKVNETVAQDLQQQVKAVENLPPAPEVNASKQSNTSSSSSSDTTAILPATAPASITLAPGSSKPVWSVINVAIPAAGATDNTGTVNGWVYSSANTVKFTVIDSGAAASLITINDSPYTSGDNYIIPSASTLTTVVTTREAGKTTCVRTFAIGVNEAVPAAAPVSVTLAPGRTNPVGAVTNVIVPLVGATDNTGTVNGWVYSSANTIKFTVADSGTAASLITINGSPYTNGDDYAITSASPLTVVVTTSEIGTINCVRTFMVTVNEAPNSTISPTAASFDKYVPSDITVTMTFNGNTLSNITNCTTALLTNTEYSVGGSTATILKEYLSSQSVGTTTLTFNFSAGNSQSLAIVISDSTPAPQLQLGVNYYVPVPGSTTGKIKIATPSLPTGATKWRIAQQASAFLVPLLNEIISGPADYTPGSNYSINVGRHLLLLATDASNQTKAYADILVGTAMINIPGYGTIAGVESGGYALKNGTVWAWGRNTNGEIGDNSTTTRKVPVQVSGLTTITAIGGKSSSGYAVKAGDKVWDWGYNGYGELGDGTKINRLVPVQASGLTTITAVTGGSYSSYALKADGTVWAWGFNGDGQLGDNTTTSRTVPMQVPGLNNITAITAGSYSSYALKSDGTVWAAGSNIGGRLGNNSTTDSHVFIQVSGLTDVTAISGGGASCYAMKSDGTVWAWGFNGDGQLGDNTTTNRLVPVQVTGLTNVTAISGGWNSGYALKSNGTVWAWGYNSSGQLGDNTTTNRNVAVQVSGLTNAIAISGGGSSGYALKSDGTIWAWGNNAYGQLGNNSTTNSPVPVQVDITPAPQLQMGVNYYVPVPGSTAGTLKIDSASLPTGATKWRIAQQAVAFLTPLLNEIVSGPVDYTPGSDYSINVGQHLLLIATDAGNHTKAYADILVGSAMINGSGYGTIASTELGGYAIKTGGTVWAWGYNGYGEVGDGSTNSRTIPVQALNLTGITTVGSKNHSGYAIKTGGTVWAWGYNQYGQLGDGSTTNRQVPVEISGLTGITAVAGGSDSGYVLKSNGTVWAWGGNSYGQLGDGSTTDNLVPVQVSGLTGITAISGGRYTGYALKADGTIWAWGYNNYGQLGNNSTTNSPVPVQVTGLTDVTAISGGWEGCYALKADGTMWAWGYNNYGQLGDGSTTTRKVPVQVTGLTNITAIAGGFSSGYALKADGTVWAWGRNHAGQLGDNSTTSRTTPVQVSGLTNVIAISGGNSSCYALKPDGTVWAWGHNGYGQLGNNSTTNSPVPVQVQL